MALTLDQIRQQSTTAAPASSSAALSLNQIRQQNTPSAQPIPAPAQSPDLLTRAGGVASKALSFTGGNSIAQSIGTLGGYLYTKAKDKLQGTNTAQNYDLSAPSPLQTAGDAAQTSLIAAPVGKIAGLLTRGAKAIGIGAKAARPVGEALTSVGTGYGYDVASNAAQGKTGADVAKPGVGTALGTILPVAGAASGAVQKIGAASAPRIINSLIKPLLKDFSYGKDPGRTVAELGITANSYDDLASKIHAARDSIGQQAFQLGRQLDPQTKLSISGALSPIDEAMTTAARNNDSTVLNRLQDVKRAITKVLVPVSDAATGHVSIAATRDRALTDLSYTEALKVKQQIGDLTKFTGNHSDDLAVNAALKRAYGNVKGGLDKAASVADPETAAKLRKFNQQYADLTSAEVATKYRDKLAARQNLISLPAGAAGIGAAVISAISTGGAAIPAILAGAGGIAVEKALATPAVKTRVAAALAKLKPQEAEGLFNKLPFLRNFKAPGDVMIDRLPAADNRGFARIPFKNVGNVHPTDKRVMADFIDAARTGKVGGGKLAPDKRLPFEIEARRAAPGYGINPDLPPAQLANRFDELLARAAKAKKTTIGQYMGK